MGFVIFAPSLNFTSTHIFLPGDPPYPFGPHVEGVASPTARSSTGMAVTQSLCPTFPVPVLPPGMSYETLQINQGLETFNLGPFKPGSASKETGFLLQDVVS